MALTKKQFNGIRQVSIDTFNGTSDKEGKLWFVKDGDKKYIYFGNQLYATNCDDCVKSVNGDGKTIDVVSDEGDQSRKKVSLKTEEKSDSTIGDGHIEIVKDSDFGVYGIMEYIQGSTDDAMESQGNRLKRLILEN